MRGRSVAERHWYIKNCQLFERLSIDKLTRLEQRARVRRFSKGSSIYLPNDEAEGICLLVEGRVKICSSTPDGKQAILAFIEPGELFGELALVDATARDENAEAAADSTVVLLPLDVLQRLMEESPALALGVTKLIGLRRKRIERRLRSLLFRSNRDRLVHLLLDLAEQYGERTAEGVLLSIKLSHQDLAAVIGATRETVTVLLGQLQLDGLLKVSRQRIVIRAIERLARIADMAIPQIKLEGNSLVPASPRGLPARQEP
jgi:CRP/FNR family cyclic AMP-dependent transcriptional regulator